MTESMPKVERDSLRFGNGSMDGPTQGFFSAVRLIERVRDNRILLSVIFGSVLLADICVITLSPKKYESAMSVLVQNTRGSLTVTSEKTSTAPPSQVVTEEQVNSELELLKGEDVAEAAFDPAWHTTAHSVSESKAHEKALARFRQHLTITALHKSNVIQISLLAEDPQRAQQMLDRFATAFLTKEKAIERPAGTSTFFAKEADRYRAQLQASQKAFSRLQQESGIVSLQDQETDLERQIQLLNADVRQVVVQIATTTSKLDATHRQLKLLPSRIATVERHVPYQLSVEQLATLLSTLTNKREDLVTRYLPGDPLVLENQREIADTTRALSDMRSSTSLESSTDVNPAWQQLQESIATLTPELNSLFARKQSLIAQIDVVHGQLAQLEQQTVQFSALKQDVIDLDANYQNYNQKRDEAEIADAMEESKILNVAIAQRPTLSFIPVSPKPLTDLILGLLTAVLLSGVALFLLDKGQDPRPFS